MNEELFKEESETVEPSERLAEKWAVEPGAMYEVESQRSDFSHRILCGDCTYREDLETLGATHVGVICTDPPYCSGGFQSAGSVSGSVGTRKDEKLERDSITTESYKELMLRALGRVTADYLYAFTDWRMWEHTKTIVEVAGYPVRQMLIWDKLYAGMGVDWRQQCEYVCFARTVPGVGEGSRGNRLECNRTKNKHHPTEKPVELIRQLVGFRTHKTCYDPFTGSGTTLIACEMERVQFFGMEVSPKHVASALERCDKLGLNVERVV
jgi:DNA modification methylase